MTLISFFDIRKQYELPAADARVIFEKLGFRVGNVEGEMMVDTSTSVLLRNHNVDAEYLIKHAVLEYRRTLDIKRTLAGEFLEWEVKGDNIKGQVGISTISPERVKPQTPSLKKKPNEQPTPAIVKAAAPPAPVAAVSAPEAFQLLAAALVEAQKAAAPTNPLLPQKQLLEAAQAGFHITSDQLGQLLGMSRSTITSKKNGFIKLGFCFEKIKEGSTTLWKVSQAT